VATLPPPAGLALRIVDCDLREGDVKVAKAARPEPNAKAPANNVLPEGSPKDGLGDPSAENDGEAEEEEEDDDEDPKPPTVTGGEGLARG